MVNFNERINRVNSLSVKWDGMENVFGHSDLLPMWVADMDFRPPEQAMEQMKQRIEHGIFGYTIIDEKVKNAITSWTNKRHNWKVDHDWLLFSPGVVPSIAIAVQAFTEVGDKILIQSPVYTPFFNIIESNMREIVNSELILKNGRYEIDFNDFEEKLKNDVKVFLLCSPHNPTGRVWSKEELGRMAQLCEKYDVVIIADEIHADIVLPPYKHIPLASLNKAYADRTLTLMAPSKTFNLAGLQASFMVAQNKEMRNKIAEIQAKNGFFALNTFGIIAMEAAYTYGEHWLNDMLSYIQANVDLIKTKVKEALPKLEVIESEGTYLVWIDCRKTGLNDADLRKVLLEKGKLAVNFGDAYGPGGEGFIRLNAACQREIVEDGVKRLIYALEAY
ncbi:MalY/PatB family protein [Lederbergia lenta]|uniref:cysteine-S-conjugate beta-lyase n=1 Tax=Lederbergia lenta TaxID=1467 RepID=A0A2X4WP77_LEDLE|nr:MalY/PatB family protein [Lederbergia lenta]MCM3113483.1 pyridoxal phosphate-dependent aminotransferase [Lederbergia lenta]MEC2326723.1 pyridoxal phosphate-dependent aminotransferase [Lederbergia lenta]SQI61518.1 class I/II aminotransferase [Lederbergia lenta]